ncbi:hydantoinase/oxoprolinase N-terminal domain-containing protein [Kordiimonas pumila]|uniref:Hydantoinase/oxoprolinase N-terminal domain-containing protein n=1 Tax=Kordiimonas pumila TaxID=2161677 RepID=A0ABV7D5G3_9PROT|nr:hydantoinase/oxoprolinase family protein [Kordiimonas pumila]
MRIGVDVGGTNTDAVLMDGRKILASEKQPTTENVSDGIVAAIKALFTTSGVAPTLIKNVMIGTTHFTNAFVERKGLLEVGVIRIALPATKGVAPMIDWPEDIAQSIGHHCYMIEGGYQCDGSLNAPLDEKALLQAVKEIGKKGLKTVAVTGLFSSVNASMEERAKDIILNELPDISVTLSSTIGRIGLLERENASIMNASLAHMSARVVKSFSDALKRLNITAPFYISQNDGTLMSAEYVEKYPVLTFASGPTNSMRGAAYLSGLKDAIVADIGGTTTDIGMLSNGFPRESTVPVDIGGVRTNFRMPDILAIGLGGGSIIKTGDALTIGPKSVGYKLLQDSLVFGGQTLTTSDIAVAAGYADFGDKSLVKHLPAKTIADAVAEIHALITEGVDRMKLSAEPVPLVLVGGGSILVNQKIPGTSNVITPEHASVANAVGASIAQIGGEIDQVYSYDEVGRETALKTAKDLAVQAAISAGAVPDSIIVTDMEEVPLAYVPGGAVRVRVKVAGDLAMEDNS